MDPSTFDSWRSTLGVEPGTDEGRRLHERGNGVTRMVWAISAGVRQLQSSAQVELGASLVEYAFLLVLVAVVALGALAFFGHTLGASLNNTANLVRNAG